MQGIQREREGKPENGQSAATRAEETSGCAVGIRQGLFDVVNNGGFSRT